MADKKISELPLLNSISGSSIVPIVHGGTTVKVDLSQLAKYASQWSAQTGSANIYYADQTINGNVNISGRLTVNEVVAQYETASVVFSSGSNVFGDQLTDTHQLTGSVNITGSLLYNGVLATNVDANTINRLEQTTSSLNIFSGSQDQRNFVISQFTASTDAHIVGITIYTSSVDSHIVGISTYTSSLEAQLRRVYQSTSSLNIFTGSQDSRNFVISQFTASTDAHIVGISTYTSSLEAQLRRVYQSTSSLNIFTGSQDQRNFVISQFTASTDNSIVGVSAFTSSQLAVNLGNSIYTSSVNDTLSRIWQTTASLQAATASATSDLSRVFQTTSSLNIFTGSQDSRNFVISQFTSSTDAHIVGISTFTSSVRIELNSIEAYTASLKSQAIVSSSTQVQNYDVFALNSKLYTGTGSLQAQLNGLMAFTAALDNTYATDAQLFQLYQATRSLELLSGSLIGITNGLMGVSASARIELNSIEAYTASLKAVAIVSSSTQITNYYKFAETASANTFYGNQTINGNLQLSSANPLVYNAGNTNAMLFGFYDGGAIYGPYYQIFGNNYSNAGQRGGAEFVYDTRNGGDGNFHVSSYNGSAWTQKFRVDDDGIEVTGSALVSGDVRANKFVFTDGVISTNVGGQYIIATSGNVTYLYTGTSGLNINDATNGNVNVSISNVGAVQTRGKLTVGSPGNDQDIAFGGSNAKLDWAGTGAQIFYSVGALQFSSVGSTNNMILQQQAGALFNAGITGSLMATNNVVSSSIQVQNYNLFALTASANTFYGTQTFSGSFNVNGSTVQIGNNTLTGNTVLSGSILVSGSSDFKNSEFRVTGSSFFTGSHTITGNSIFSGSINIASGSSYYRAGNKLFNYGQWVSLETQSGSADTAYAIKLGTTTGNLEGFYVANNGSGFPTRITAVNTGLYNLQFSLQLNTTATETCDFSVWFAMTGSAIANSNTDFSINKTAGGGNGVAALNLLTQITAGDYVELYWSKTTANGQLQYKASQSTPTRPVTPSAIVTITQHA